MAIIENLEEIRETAKEFFKKITAEADVVFLPLEEAPSSYSEEEKIFVLPIEIESKEPQVLIGERGQTLQEMQHLLKAILRKKFNQKFFINIDVNDYKKKKEKYLKEVAMSLADEAVFSKKEKKLPPMPSYERRIIHLELSKREDVVSESMGDGFQKEIIIKPLI